MLLYRKNKNKSRCGVKDKKAIVLLSGGLDSATTLYIAKRAGYNTQCLIFNYNQRHRKEIECSKEIAKKTKSSFKVVKIKLPWRGSSLLDKNTKLPQNRKSKGIPSTYVPARNTIFIAFAISWAEAIKAEAVYIGANAVDYSGYPDCRPEYFMRYKALVKEGLKKNNIRIQTPLIDKTKAEIIKIGISLGVPYHLTWSCYKGDKEPCMKCDSCRLRRKGFREARIKDPAL